jgi:conjugal transfer pilus assembly protein TraW
MRRYAHIPLLTLVCFIFSVTCSAKDLGVYGAVYGIAEKDALKEIEDRVKEANTNRIVNKGELVKKLRNYAPEDLKEMKLPPAQKERTFFVDMTYTLDRDIADEKGNVVYPKGYMFNPLDYVAYPGTIVILNGNSATQVAWFKHSGHNADLKAKLLITDGSYAELSKALKRPVFYASQAVINVFQIKAVPSVVQQKGNLMEVREIVMVEKKAQ